MDRARSLLVLDTNIFLEAHRRYYAQDICPGFWECLRHYALKGSLLSIDRVLKEILEPDEVAKWARQAPDELFASTAEQPVIDAFKQMQSWAQGNTQFRVEAREEFARVADGG